MLCLCKNWVESLGCLTLGHKQERRPSTAQAPGNRPLLPSWDWGLISVSSVFYCQLLCKVVRRQACS